MEEQKTTLLQQWIEEIKIDTRVDEFSMKEKNLCLPGVKHKWVARGIQNKLQIQKLQKERSKLIREIAEKVKEEAPVKLTQIGAEKAAEGHEKVINLDEQIKECKMIEEYLEKVEKIFSSMTWDFRNILKIQELELL